MSEENRLVSTVKASGLTAQTAELLLQAFQPAFNQAAELTIAANAISVTDATQVTEIKKARTMRLAIKDVRVEAEKIRTALKEDSLRMGRGIDNVARVIKSMCEPAEAALLAMEEFAERAERARAAKLHAERAEALRPYADPQHYPLGVMNEREWDQLLAASKTAHEKRVEDERKAAEEKAAREQADREERERMRAENDRLRQEAEAREAEARREREKAAAEKKKLEDQARKEREAREALERQERDRKDAEAKKAKAEAAARRKAERAPDQAKLLGLAKELRAIHEPVVSIGRAENVRGQCMGIIADAAKAIEELVEQEFGE